MSKSLNILLIEDDEVDRMTIRHVLAKANLNANIHEVTNCKDGVEKIKNGDIDCALVDFKLPDAMGIEVIERLREADGKGTPLIFLTGMGSEMLAAEVMKKGAADYISKNGLNGDVLVRSIQNAIQVHQYQRKAEAAENALLEREKQYRTIVDTVSDIIMRLGTDQKIEFVNPAVRFLGYDPSEMVGQPIEKFVTKVDGVEYEEGLISQIATRGVGPMATNNLEVNFLVEKESTLWEQNKSIPVLMDAFGLWDVPEEMVFKRGVEKNFLGTLCIARNITEVKAVEEELLRTQARLIGAVEELKELTTQDALTKIANRRFFDDYLEKEWKRAQRDQGPFSIVMIDLDYFKLYNDTYGHQQGDKCLRDVATVINEGMQRPADMAARYGGEEFALILPETNSKGAVGLAEKLCKSVYDLNIEHKNKSDEPRVTISLGTATAIANKENNFFDLIAQADKALYTAKDMGRNRVVAYEEK